MDGPSTRVAFCGRARIRYGGVDGRKQPGKTQPFVSRSIAAKSIRLVARHEIDRPNARNVLNGVLPSRESPM